MADETTYRPALFERLEPRTPWTGGRIADTDVLTLEDASRFASVHAGQEISPGDFLRAGARGEIQLHAIVHRSARTRPCAPGIAPLNNGEPVPEGAIPTLPLIACRALAVTGRASWRTFERLQAPGDKPGLGAWCYYDAWELEADEPPFETVPADCRVTGRDTRALADSFLLDMEEPEGAPDAAGAAGEPGPVALVVRYFDDERPAYTVEDALELTATALHPRYGQDPDDIKCDIRREYAREKHHAALEQAIAAGDVVVRNRLTSAPYEVSSGKGLLRAMIARDDLQRFAWDRLRIELRRRTEHISAEKRRHSVLFTLEEAAESLATQEGWHQGARDSLIQAMVFAAQNGELTVRDPHTDLPCKSAKVETYYHLVTPVDVNAWLDASGVEYRWRTAGDSPTPDLTDGALTEPHATNAAGSADSKRDQAHYAAIFDDNARDWRDRVRARASAWWLDCDPSTKPNRSVAADFCAKWCREHVPVNLSGSRPTKEYIRHHVLDTKHWNPPN